MEIQTRDAIIILKFRGFRNCDIARQLDISRQYVSHVCNSLQNMTKQPEGSPKRGVEECEWEPGSNRLLTVGAASRLLGVSPATVRRWSDKRQIPSIRLDLGRKDRRFKVADLERFLVSIQAEKDLSLTHSRS
jgi:excisionase family DNA binding protein